MSANVEIKAAGRNPITGQDEPFRVKITNGDLIIEVEKIIRGGKRVRWTYAINEFRVYGEDTLLVIAKRVYRFANGDGTFSWATKGREHYFTTAGEMKRARTIEALSW